MRCRNCNRTIPASEAFCAYCGVSVAPLPPGKFPSWVARHKFLSMVGVAAALLVLFVVVSSVARGCTGDPQSSPGTETPTPTVDEKPTPPPTPTPTPMKTQRIPPTECLDSEPPPVSVVVENARRGIVEIFTATGSGTGFIVTADGVIATNRHVVEGSRDVRIRLETGGTFLGEVFGLHSSLDLAYIRVDSGREFQPMGLGDSD